MSLETAIAATTAVATSDAITLSGPIEIRAFGLEGTQKIVIQWETLTGSFENAKGGPGVTVLTAQSPSTIYIGYSDIKVKKPEATTNQVSVGYALAS